MFLYNKLFHENSGASGLTKVNVTVHVQFKESLFLARFHCNGKFLLLESHKDVDSTVD